MYAQHLVCSCLQVELDCVVETDDVVFIIEAKSGQMAKNAVGQMDKATENLR